MSTNTRQAVLNFKDKLTAGFNDLRWGRGYFAAQCFQCCQTCGVHSVPDQYADRYAFYHEQDARKLDHASEQQEIGVFLSWGGDAAIIRKAFEAVGCAVIHDGSPNKRIWVYGLPTMGLETHAAKKDAQQVENVNLLAGMDW
jgi:Domain of unknown function (DUF6891)